MKGTQEMLDFAAKHGVGADVETIKIQYINEAFEKTMRGEVRYRFVVDLGSLTTGS